MVLVSTPILLRRSSVLLSPCLTQVFFHTSLEAVFIIFFLLFLFLLIAHAFCVNLDTAVVRVRPWLSGWPFYPRDGNDISSLTLGASWPRPRPCSTTGNLLGMFPIKSIPRCQTLTSLSYYLARHHPPLGVICPYLIVIKE